MEVVGLSLGAVALASLFSTCLECFECFHAVKCFSVDLNILLLKLDCQKERLLTWGEIVGISQDRLEDRDPALETHKAELIQRCLCTITTLFADSDKLRRQYGVKRIDTPDAISDSLVHITSERATRFRNSYQKLAPSSKQSKQASLVKRTKWAIHHKTKFQILINHIKDIITDLHTILPVPARLQEKMIHKDIASLSVPALRQIQKACEFEYPSWSDVASAIMTASELGTIDHRSIDEWLQNADYTIDEDSEMAVIPNSPSDSSETCEGFDLHVSHNTEIYFIFTSQCESQDTARSCNEKAFGFMSLRRHGQTFLGGIGIETSATKSKRIGQLLTKTLSEKLDPEDMRLLLRANIELGNFHEASVQLNLPLGNVFVYCAPCACAVRTALTICEEGQSKYITYMTRVDDRVSASCCPTSTEEERLISLITILKQLEATDGAETFELRTDWIEYIDRVWLEQRLYALEQGFDPHDPTRSVTAQGAELFADFRPEPKATAMVLLGELDYCHWMLETHPFPWKVRAPKETEIYQLTKRQTDSAWMRTFLGTYTPSTFSPYRSVRNAPRIASSTVSKRGKDSNTKGSSKIHA